MSSLLSSERSGSESGFVRGCADVVNQMSGCNGARLWDEEVLSAGKSVVLVVGDRREWCVGTRRRCLVRCCQSRAPGGVGVVEVIEVWRGNDAVWIGDWRVWYGGSTSEDEVA